MFILGVLVTAGCWRLHASRTFPMPTRPDRQCTAGWNELWIWDCLEGQHVVIHQFCGEWGGCKPPLKDVYACGETSGYERSIQPGHCDISAPGW